MGVGEVLSLWGLAPPTFENVPTPMASDNCAGGLFLNDKRFSMLLISALIFHGFLRRYCVCTGAMSFRYTDSTPTLVGVETALCGNLS